MTEAVHDLLEQYFDAAFSTPDGIAKLRELILTLAMQGKLVEQDPNDLPASELLKEIEAQKYRLIKEWKIKKPKSVSPIKPEEIPYSPPQKWEWVRLGEIGIINPRNSDVDDLAIAGFVPMPLISEGYSITHQFEERIWSKIKKGYTHFADGDVGMAKITPCFENAKSCVFSGLPNGIGAGTTELHIFRNTFNSVIPRFLLYFLKNPHYISQAVTKMTGSAGQKRVPTTYFSEQLFPLPPIQEQHRIVARIDQLMTRCDELEKLHKEREEKRLAVHTAAVRQLINKPESNSWRFIQQHFGELYTVKENVEELRKAILQLAVMGRLVPQDPNDPPASELIKEIQAEKQLLIKEEKIKKPKSLPPIKSEEVPYILPKGWEWVRLDMVTSKITDGDHKTPPRITEGRRLLSAKNVRDGYLNFENCDFISEQHYQKSRERCLPETGDLLIVSVGGTIGRTSLVPQDSDFALVRSVALIKPLFLNSQYLKYAMDSELLQSSIHKKKRGGAQPCLYLSEIQLFPFSLPPLPEQHRIVARIDELMALCDKLDQQIEAANNKRIELLNAVIAQV